MTKELSKKEKRKASQKAYFNKNKKTIYANRKKWLEKNPEKKEKINITAKKFAKENKEHVKKYMKEYREKFSEKLKAYNKTYLIKGYWKAYVGKIKDDPEKLKEFRAKKSSYYRKKREIDPMFKLRLLMRNRIKNILKAKKITTKHKSLDLIGCTTQDLKSHIEKQFKKGMTWGNHKNNGWHIDHIIPLDIAKNEEELIKLCHYTNLQPLWASENRKKSNKL